MWRCVCFKICDGCQAEFGVLSLQLKCVAVWGSYLGSNSDTTDTNDENNSQLGTLSSLT